MNLYEDNPDSNLEYIKSLGVKELEQYVKGYILACHHMREAFTKGKVDLLEAALAQEGSAKDSLISSVKVLDSYEILVKAKEKKLRSMFPEFFKATR